MYIVNRLDKISGCQPSMAWWQKLQLYLSPIHASHVSCASLECYRQNTQEKDHPQAMRKCHPKNQGKTPARSGQKYYTWMQSIIMYYPVLSQHSRNGKIQAVARCLSWVKNASLPLNTCCLCFGKTSKTHKLKRTEDWLSQDLAMSALN